MKNSFILKLLGLIIPTVFVTCCSDNIAFVTKTSFSLEASTKPAAVSIGYDRFEGYVGPKEQGKEPPSVVGGFSSSGDFFNPHLYEIYAVGPASESVVTGDTSKCDESTNKSKANTTPVIVSTSSTVGLKLGYDGSSPVGISDILLGYRRKEITYVKHQEGDTPPSVLAEFQINVTTTTEDNKIATVETSAAGIGQFFATGRSACLLANNKNIQALFANRLLEAPILLK